MASRSATIEVKRSRSQRAVSLERGRGHPATLLTTAVCALTVLGLVMILSASSVSSFATYGSSFLFFKKQLVWAAIGLAGFFFFARLDYRKLRGFGYVLYALVIGLLIAVLVPGVGIIAGGSARWLGAGPLSFQPSELAKLALILFAADVFTRKKEKTLQIMSHVLFPLGPALAMLGLLVMLQPDMGSALLLGVIGIGLLFVAGAPPRHLLPMTGLGALAAGVAAFGEPYRRARLFAFMDPWADPLNTGYQTIQSLIALGSGGWFGVGLGASRQKWSYVPNAHTDFIFAIIGEELGLLGTLVVLGMFAFIGYLGITIARRAPDRFGMLVAAGITIWMMSQALVNMGAVTAAMPITGVPLPLVSFGGSSLVVSLVSMGILVNIARNGVPRKARVAGSRTSSAGG